MIWHTSTVYPYLHQSFLFLRAVINSEIIGINCDGVRKWWQENDERRNTISLSLPWKFWRWRLPHTWIREIFISSAVRKAWKTSQRKSYFRTWRSMKIPMEVLGNGSILLLMCCVPWEHLLTFNLFICKVKVIVYSLCSLYVHIFLPVNKGIF